MARIISIEPHVKEAKVFNNKGEQTGTEQRTSYRIVTDTDVLYPTKKMFDKAKGLLRDSDDVDFINGEVIPSYYKKGEKLINGTTVDKDNVLLKGISLQPSSVALAMDKAVTCGFKGAIALLAVTALSVAIRRTELTGNAEYSWGNLIATLSIHSVVYRFCEAVIATRQVNIILTIKH